METMSNTINVEKSLINVIDNADNRLAVSNEIINRLYTEHLLGDTTDSNTAIYVRNFLAGVELYRLLTIETVDVYTYVKTDLMNKFLEKYEIIKPENFADLTDWNTATRWFEKFDLNEMYLMCFEKEDFYSSDYEEYIGEVLPDFLPDYNFDIQIDFFVNDDEGKYDLDTIKEMIKRRITKRWRACKLEQTLIFTSSARMGYDGYIKLHIDGNATYTMDTIKKAISNRLGANARWHKWEDFVIEKVYSV